MSDLGFGTASLGTGGRRAEETFNQIGQRPDFAVGQFSRPAGNRKAGREGADKDGPVADRRTNVFAKGDEFFDQLLTFKCSPIHPVRDQDQAGNTAWGDFAPRRRSRGCVSSPQGPSQRECRGPAPGLKSRLRHRASDRWAVSMTTQPALIRCACSAGEVSHRANTVFSNLISK